MKRKIENSITGTRVRKTNLLNNRSDFKEWVSASKTRNYLIQDPILDYLELYGKTKNYKKDYEREYFNESLCFCKYIMEKGIEFEEKIIVLLKEIFNGDFIQISHNDNIDSMNGDLFNKSIQAIKNKVGLIIHPVFHDYITKVYGVPDLLIRSDKLKLIMNNKHEEGLINEIIKRQTYIVVDIKFTTLHFNSNWVTLRNSGNTRAYKGQIAIYNKILTNILLKHTNETKKPRYALILGRRSNLTDNAFEKLGVVDFRDFDKKYIELSEEAIEWYRKIKNTEDIKIYPNMSNTNDLPWHYAKKEIAKESKEITQMLYIGPTVRNKLVEKGITSIDKLKTDDLKGLIGDKILNTIDSIIKTNNINNKEIICPSKFKLAFNPETAFYVDFETVSDINDTFEELPKAGGVNMIYMIGCGYIENDKWEFKNFVVDKLEKSEEDKIVTEWLYFMVSKINETNRKDINVVHWSNTEESLYRSIKERLDNNKIINICQELMFYNIHKLFVGVPITIKGLYNFKLKNVAKALSNYNLINTNWGKSSVDGIGSIIACIKSNQIAKEQGISLKSIPMIKEIQYYNEIDCKVMYEICVLINQK